MYWLIEDLEQLKTFYNSGYKKAYIEIISNNDQIHPAINDLCAVYIRPLEASKGFMLCISHSEAINVEKDWVYKILQKFDVLYCKNKKQLLHYFILQNLEDILLPPSNIDLPNIPTYDIMYRKYHKLDNVNTLVPLVKHYEWCESIYNEVKPLIHQEKTPYYEFYNTKTSVVFNAIERNGIGINPELFSEHFYPTKADTVHTQFNLNTTTTRPSNKFKGVNYAALNKKNGERRCFIPKNDEFIELDVVAYHPSIAASLIDYTFPTADIHTHFSEMYEVDRSKAKELTFKQLYGGIFKEYKDLPFFRDLQTFMDKLWYQFQNEGYIECPISQYRFHKNNLENMNSNKLFNYLLQSIETSQNTLVTWDIFRILTQYESKLIHYTFDSVLLDFDSSEESELLPLIKDVFLKYKLNISEVRGKNYGDIK